MYQKDCLFKVGSLEGYRTLHPKGFVVDPDKRTESIEFFEVKFQGKTVLETYIKDEFYKKIKEIGDSLPAEDWEIEWPDADPDQDKGDPYTPVPRKGRKKPVGKAN